jgi:hypothetical protein
MKRDYEMKNKEHQISTIAERERWKLYQFSLDDRENDCGCWREGTDFCVAARKVSGKQTIQ